VRSSDLVRNPADEGHAVVFSSPSGGLPAHPLRSPLNETFFSFWQWFTYLKEAEFLVMTSPLLSRIRPVYFGLLS